MTHELWCAELIEETPMLTGLGEDQEEIWPDNMSPVEQAHSAEVHLTSCIDCAVNSKAHNVAIDLLCAI